MLDQIGDGVAHFQTKLDVNLNIEFDGRSITGDDPYNYKDKRYGNAFVVGSLEDECTVRMWQELPWQLETTVLE